MSEITAIEPQKRDKTRCNIYVDGRFCCGLTLEAAIKHRLKTGMQIDKEFLGKLQLETDKNTALEKALTHISATMKTERQIRDFLKAKGYTEAVLDYVTDKMREYGFLDDYAYCKAYISSARSKGAKLIKSELIKRGAEKNALERAMSEYEENIDEARVVAEKYLKHKEKTKQNRYKAERYLISRGYSYDTAKSALGVDEPNEGD